MTTSTAKLFPGVQQNLAPVKHLQPLPSPAQGFTNWLSISADASALGTHGKWSYGTMCGLLQLAFFTLHLPLPPTVGTQLSQKVHPGHTLSSKGWHCLGG